MMSSPCLAEHAYEGGHSRARDGRITSSALFLTVASRGHQAMKGKTAERGL